MEEHRQFVRLDTRLQVSYSLVPSEGSQETVTRNISSGGICLFTDSVLSPDTRLQITIHLPNRKQPVQAMGEVVWSEPYEVVSKAGRFPAIESGVRFLNIAPDDFEAIKQHVILSLQQSSLPERRRIQGQPPIS